MANPEHLAILKQGVEVWNRWRKHNPNVVGSLSEADLHVMDFSRGNFQGTDLRKATLEGAIFRDANLKQADLREANLHAAYLRGTNLTEAKLDGARLTNATLVGTNVNGASFTSCSIYGISAWDLQGEPKNQDDLIITLGGPVVTVDKLEVAQFVYLLLNNRTIRGVIETVTSKAVLILGSFTKDRKPVLEAIRNLLRPKYVPILFDWKKPSSRDIDETVSTLAHMARFIIADITDARSIPQELERIVPNLPSVPVQPLILATEPEFGMFEHFLRYQWVLKLFRYEDTPRLLAAFSEKLLKSIEDKVKEQTKG
jgi:uncharacterized protein YjbI with pentapeptide repeats